MRVFVGTDHAGLEFKDHLKQALTDAGHQPVDCVAFEYDVEDDYPTLFFEDGDRPITEPCSLGLVLVGSGNCGAIEVN